jgi:hypothetical protein
LRIVSVNFVFDGCLVRTKFFEMVVNFSEVALLDFILFIKSNKLFVETIEFSVKLGLEVLNMPSLSGDHLSVVSPLGTFSLDSS